MASAKNMSALKQIAILLVVAAGAGAAWYFDAMSMVTGETAAPNRRSAVSQRPAPVVVERVALKSDAAIVQAVGTADAKKSVTIHPRVTGRVVEILFKAGQRVAKGEPLVRLDFEDENFAVKLAELTLKDARSKLDRYRKVVRSGGITRSQLDIAETAVEAARIRLSRAKIALARRTVKAPFAGVVGIPSVEVGDRVTEETAITTLDDRSILLVDFNIPENFLYGIRRGSDLTATTWARPGEVFKGVLATLSSRVDEATRTLRVRAELPNRDDRLRPGMAFSIRLPLAGNRFPSVPSVAIQWRRKGAYVWVIRDGKAVRVPVDVLKRSDRWVLVDAKLTANDVVVVEGVQRLRAAKAVKVVSESAPSGKPTQ